MQFGFYCYADDSACLTTHYQIAGMPFALALRESPRFRPSNLNQTSPAVPPKALIWVNYQSTAATTTSQPLDTFEALLEFQKSGFWIGHTKPAISSFLEWLASIPRFKLTYSDSTTTLPIIQALLT